MTTLGQAYVQIMPSSKGISGSIQKTINPEATAAGKSAGSRIASSMAKSMGGAGKTLTKAITVPALGAATAVGGIVAAFGWGRLKSVDAAQAQLRGLGYETEDVERISEQLAGALEGGMLTMGEATSAAATAMASGVEEGKELTRYIQILDGTVAGSTGTFEEMEQIFGRIVDQGSITRNEFDMIAQRMPGFSKAVQDNMEISSDEMYDMLREGEITTDQFLDIMEDFSGDMATEYAKSWGGMVENTKAYIGILGESLLGGVFEQSKESIAEFIEYLSSDEVIEWGQQVGQSIGETFENVVESIKNAIEWWTDLDDSTKNLIQTIGIIAVAIGPVLLVLASMVSTFMKILPLIKLVGAAIGLLASPIGLIVAAVAGLVAVVVIYWEEIRDFTIEVFSAIGEFFVNTWNWIKDTFFTVIDAVSGFVSDSWNWIKDTTLSIWNGISQFFSTLWNGIKSTASNIFNGIKNVISNVWNAIKTVTSNVWNGITGTISTIIDGISSTTSKVFNGIKDTISKVWNGVKSATSRIWDGIVRVVKAPINTIIGFINGMINALNGINISIPKVPDWVPGIGGRGGGSIGFNIPNVPSLDVGTNYVAQDGLAYLHAGEAVVPKKYNPAAGGSDMNKVESLLIDLVKAVKENKDVFIDGERVTDKVNELNAINAVVGGYMD